MTGPVFADKHGVIDIDELWQAAARKLQVPAPAPRNLDTEGLRVLASALQSGGRYDASALRLLRREVFAWILSYLNFGEDLARYPAIAQVPVRRPLLVAGYGRTGSTFLHNLLALDPDARAPLLWELWTPSPPPRAETQASDPRIDIAQRRLDTFTRADPLIRHIHPMAARAPDECHWMMRHSPLAAMLYQVPEYWAWLKSLPASDLGELYAHYRRQVQHLQLFRHRRHWLSKASSHLHYMPVLFDVFPDANVVRLHRHPCQAIASLCSLMASYRRLVSPRVDHREIGTTLLDMFEDGMRRSMAAAPPVDRRHFIDIRYEELVADPIAIVRRIYAQFGYTYSASFERDMARHLAVALAESRPRHDYSLKQFALSPGQVIERSADYIRWVSQQCGEFADLSAA